MCAMKRVIRRGYHPGSTNVRAAAETRQKPAAAMLETCNTGLCRTPCGVLRCPRLLGQGRAPDGIPPATAEGKNGSFMQRMKRGENFPQGCARGEGYATLSEWRGERDSGEERTSSSSRRSWMMFATAFCLMHLALSMYLSA